MKVRALVGLLVLVLAVALPASAEPPGPIPLPEAGVAHPAVASVTAGECTPESVYDQPNYYGADCKRLHVVFGPYLAKPGQNDVIILPVTYEKPLYPGYMVRRKPGLVELVHAAGRSTNVTPPVEEIHLHHGTWASVGRSYGSGPMWASGEEKTILHFPQGTGVLVEPSDGWLFLNMIHNATATARVVYVTDDIDYVERTVAETKYGMKNTRQIWLDVGGGSFHPQTQTYGLNPIFNAQRGFGHVDTGSFWGVPGVSFADGLGRRVCYFPKENCARFNSAGNVSAQQGLDVTGQVPGKDLVIGDAALGPGVNEGTLIMMGGHVHPGGVRDEVSLVRGAVQDPVTKIWTGGVEKPIHISDTIYWDHNNPSMPGGLPTSWDFSMTGVNARMGWAIRVKRGDILRLNGVYDTHYASTYEQMGIVMTWVIPGDATGVDVFDDNVVLDAGYPTTATLPPGLTATCTPGLNAEGKTVVCLRGSVTRPSLEANQNHGLADLGQLPEREGPMLTQINIAGFTYGEADLGVIFATGMIPRVRLGQPLTFLNEDTGAYIWHTVTRCAAPCTGSTTVDYPYANGGNGSATDVMDFDSSELGYGVAPAQRATWTFTPTQPGVFTFFCRIHPQMRGAFEVAP